MGRGQESGGFRHPASCVPSPACDKDRRGPCPAPELTPVGRVKPVLLGGDFKGKQEGWVPVLSFLSICKAEDVMSSGQLWVGRTENLEHGKAKWEGRGVHMGSTFGERG